MNAERKESKKIIQHRLGMNGGVLPKGLQLKHKERNRRRKEMREDDWRKGRRRNGRKRTNRKKRRRMR